MNRQSIASHSVQLGRVQTYEFEVDVDHGAVEGTIAAKTLDNDCYDDMDWSKMCNVDNEEFVDFIDETKIFRS